MGGFLIRGGFSPPNLNHYILIRRHYLFDRGVFLISGLVFFFNSEGFSNQGWGLMCVCIYVYICIYTHMYIPLCLLLSEGTPLHPPQVRAFELPAANIIINIIIDIITNITIHITSNINIMSNIYLISNINTNSEISAFGAGHVRAFELPAACSLVCSPICVYIYIYMYAYIYIYIYILVCVYAYIYIYS